MTTTLRKVLLACIGLVLLIVVALAGFAWWSLQPRADALDLPDGLIALSDSRGESLLREADAKADFAMLVEHYESQELRSFCGVASSVIVLNSLGRELDQHSFFDVGSASVKPRFGVMFGGMTLEELTAYLEAHGGAAEMHYADAVAIDEFREIVRENLQDPGNFLLVNYQREVLGQRRVGHISPIGAYDADTDRVLILDTASYNYPPTWVPLTRLHAAMAAVDPSSGKARGFVEIAAAR